MNFQGAHNEKGVLNGKLDEEETFFLGYRNFAIFPLYFFSFDS